MRGPIYKPQSFYKSDINDMVEETLTKGGPGSGVKGHKTMAEAKRHLNQQSDAKAGRLDKLQGHSKYWQGRYQSAKQAGHKEDTEHYKKLRNEADSHVMSRLNSGSKDMQKGGPGSGVKGHQTNHPVHDHFQTVPSEHLSGIVGGKIDPSKVARHELSNRGHDENGNWVGFKQAEKVHGKHTLNEHEQKVHEHFQTFPSKALHHEVDFKDAAKRQLANRGQDSKGAWVGFDQAAKHHGLDKK